MKSSELWVALATVLITLLALEGSARVWVALRWPPGMAYPLTHATNVRGGLLGDRALFYTPAPHYSKGERRHNSLGFRGPEFSVARTPGVARVVLMGASQVYATGMQDDETPAARLQQALAARGVRAEVINAGVPGWTSRGTRLSFEPRILPLSPDVIVIVDGRNDVYPQLFRNYRDDYGHFHDLDYDMANTNRGWKRAFAVSHLLMGLMHRREVLGFKPQQESPVYGSIRFENQPTLAEAGSFAGAPERAHGFVENLRGTIEAARAAGVDPILAVSPHRPDGEFHSGYLPATGGFFPFVSKQALINQELTRQLAAETGTTLVDTPELWTAEFLRDDCHFNGAGATAFAARLLEAVAPLVAPRGATEPERRPATRGWSPSGSSPVQP